MMTNKKALNLISMIVLIIAVVLSFYLTIKKGEEEVKKAYEAPLKSVTILGNTLNLDDDKRSYTAFVKCADYEENTQIINYTLKTKDNVTVNSKFYKNNKIIEKPSKDMTNFEIYLNVLNEKQEIVYHFMLVCEGYDA